MTLAYTAGTITLTNGSKAVTGIGTGWVTALIAGGVIYPDASGNALPIKTVNSNTSITLDVAWKGATGTYSYAIVRDTAYLQQLSANAQALATYIARLDSASLGALAAIASTLGAGKVPRGLSGSTMEWFTVSDFFKTLLDDPDVASFWATIGATAPADKAFRRGNILATVAQASGIPTGGLIERGSNANGEYVRFADGTQICMSPDLSVTPGSGYADILWTFPATFAAVSPWSVAIPSFANADGGGSFRYRYLVSARSRSSTQAVFATALISGAPASAGVAWTGNQIISFGRWF